MDEGEQGRVEAFLRLVNQESQRSEVEREFKATVYWELKACGGFRSGYRAQGSHEGIGDMVLGLLKEGRQSWGLPV